MTRKRRSQKHTRESYDSSPSGSEPAVRRRRKTRRNSDESSKSRTSESRGRNAPRSSPGSRRRGATRDVSRSRHASRRRDASQAATRDVSRSRHASRRRDATQAASAATRDVSRSRHASRRRDATQAATRDVSRSRHASRRRDATQAATRDVSRSRHASRRRDATQAATRDVSRSRHASRRRDATQAASAETRDALHDATCDETRNASRTRDASRSRHASRMRGAARDASRDGTCEGAHDASRSRSVSRMRDAPRLCDVSPGREVAHGRDASCNRDMPRRHSQDIARASRSDITPAAVVSPFDSIKDADTNTNILVSVFKEFMQTMKADGGSERFPVLNVIPEFDPSKRTQTIETWISKVNECSQIYNWTERQTVHYALPKLAGLAQKWYQGLPSLLFSWAEWQSKLKLAFPSDQNYGQLLTEMLACRADFGESLEEYFYQKVVLLNRCNIHGKNAIDCILFGIEDRSVRTSAEATQFTEPDKLLVYLRNIRVTKKFNEPNSSLRAGNADSKQSKTLKATQNDHDNRNSRNYRLTKCYNCGEEGHPYFKCKLPIKRCDKCRQVGHLAENCPGTKESSNNKTVLRISKEPEF